ncbi:MAG: hypothetical protein HC769_19875 [Cyanobacteria bacterium CRU_2_1]|nr:hypothetical protein [Cyanobacteria bacterium RU_5_0]NJR60880.1 hypothetical protein [Cyanobacteria bacterium CRU_2_1]
MNKRYSQEQIISFDLTTEIGKRRAISKLLKPEQGKAQIFSSFLFLLWGFVFWITLNVQDHVILSVVLALILSVWLVPPVYDYYQKRKIIRKIVRYERQDKQIKEIIKFGEAQNLDSLEIQLRCCFG